MGPWQTKKKEEHSTLVLVNRVIEYVVIHVFI
jgi:hypothetical protein